MSYFSLKFCSLILTFICGSCLHQLLLQISNSNFSIFLIPSTLVQNSVRKFILINSNSVRKINLFFIYLLSNHYL